MDDFEIIDLTAGDTAAIRQAARLLYDSFRQDWPEAWPDLASAEQEVRQSIGPDRLSRIAVEAQGAVLGWIGGQPHYEGRVWELHPLVVSPDHRRRGLGRALVADLEALARARGGLTLWLGTDDENNLTSLGGANLYPDVLRQLQRIRNLGGHPYSFYEKLGFVIVGVLPDANGPGKPDIFMAKSLVTPSKT